jgi:hypothetical protein
MNNIKPLTQDGLVGWDSYGQLWCYRWKNGIREGVIIADVREKTCCVCRRGWELTAESLGDQHRWDSRAEWAHKSCYIRHLALNEYEFWNNALVEARFMFGQIDNPRTIGEAPDLEALPNEYWSKGDPWGDGLPWYRARLLKRVNVEKSENGPLGRTLRLGTRKNVHHLEIEVGFGPFDRALAIELFRSEEVTSRIDEDCMFVHAWGRDKAREYLKHFAKILGVTAVPLEVAITNQSKGNG